MYLKWVFEEKLGIVREIYKGLIMVESGYNFWFNGVKGGVGVRRREGVERLYIGVGVNL